MKSAFTRALAAALALIPSATHGDTLYWLGAKLPNGPNQPYSYLVDETSPPPGPLSLSAIQSETEAAFATWGDAGCSYLGFAFGGAIIEASMLGNHQDSQSAMSGVVTAASDPRYDQDLGGGVAIGVALTYAVDGVIVGCDTEYNGVDFDLGDQGSPTQMDFPSLALHEAGHCVGLAHQPNDPQSVMYATLLTGQTRRVLDPNDVSNICQLYPLTGALGSPCSAGSCGAGLWCIADPTEGGMFCSRPCDLSAGGGCGAGFGCRSAVGAIADGGAACFPGLGDQTPLIGAACSKDSDCQGVGAACLTAAQGWPGGFCTEACGTAPCPPDTVCAPVGDAGMGCLSRCSTLGGCRPGYACNPRDAFGDGVCEPACTALSGCPAGGTCLCSGVCAPPGNPAGSVGAPCDVGADCATGDLCIPGTVDGGSTGWAGGSCTAPCGGPASCGGCPKGSSCVVISDEGQALCLETCAASSSSACRAGYGCIPEGAVSVCEPGCSSDAACPVGTTCVAGNCLEPDQLDGGGCTLCVDAGTVGHSSGGSTPPNRDSPSCGCSVREPGLGSAAWPMVLAWVVRKRRR